MTKKWFFWLLLGLLFLVFVFLIRSILLPFVVGMLAAYFLDPAADALERKGWSRTYATLVITGGFFFVLAMLCILIPPLIIEQFAGLLATLPHYIAELKAQYDGQFSRWLGMFQAEDAKSIKQAAAESTGGVVSFIGDFIGKIFQSGFVIINAFALILITPVVTFYLLRDWDKVVAHFDNLLPRQHADTIRAQMHNIDRALAGFLHGQFNVCLILAVFYAIGLTLAGLKFGLLIGLLAGFLVFVPYVGPLVSTVLGVGIAYFQFEFYADILMVLGVFLGGQALESYFLTPKLVGEKVGLHPVWVIFGLLAGGALFGFVGVLLAVPATAVIGVLIRFATDRYLHSSYYSGSAP